MNIRFYFQKIKEEEKEDLEKYFDDKKIARILRLLQEKDLELANLVLNAKYHQHHNIFLVRLGLNIGRKNLFSEEKGHMLIEAFDLALDELVIQLRKLEEKRTNKKKGNKNIRN